MHVLRIISFWLTFVFFSAFLVLSLVVPPVTTHITDREAVKSWVNDPNVLNGIGEVVPEIISESLNEESSLVQVSDTPLGVDIDQLVDAAQEVLTPEYLAGKTDPIIDGVYAWLEGDTEEPEFEIDLSDKLNAVVVALKAPLRSELAKLPVCPSNISHTDDFNLFETPCVPQDVDIDKIVDTFSEFITGSDADIDFTVSSENIDFSEEVINYGPNVFAGLSAMPVFFALMTILFGTATVFLASSRAKGLRMLSWSMIFNGIIIAIGFWLISGINNFSSEANDPLEELIFEKVATPLLQAILADISKTGLLLSLFTVVIGIIIWLLTHVHKKVHKEHELHQKSVGKLKDATPSERQESIYINKIANENKKSKKKKNTKPQKK